MARINEQERLHELTKRERKFWNAGIYPAGMDEVGRGPLAGPVVTCCVILPSEPLIEHINDSKKVTELRRTKLAPIIEAQAVAIGYGWCTNGEIDELNILNATKKAFRQAYFAMEHDCSQVLIDAVNTGLIDNFIRFDVIEVDLDTLQVEHIIDAFRLN